MLNNPMIKTMALFSVIMTSMLMTACGQQALPNASTPRTHVQAFNASAEHEPAQVIVRFKPHVLQNDLLEFQAKYGVKILKKLPSLNAYVMVADSTVWLKASQLVDYMNQDPLVLYAEINATVSFMTRL